MEKLLQTTYQIAAANHPFLLEETVICAKKLAQGADWEEISQAALGDDLLGAISPSTATAYLRAIRFRLEDTSTDVLGLLIGTDQQTARCTLFYILLNKNRLLRELMEEPVRDAWLDGQPSLSREQIEAFFERKRKRSPILTEWSDTTWRKFWLNTLKSVVETGLLEGQDPLVIHQIQLPKAFREALVSRQDQSFLHLMLAEGF